MWRRDARVQGGGDALDQTRAAATLPRFETLIKDAAADATDDLVPPPFLHRVVGGAGLRAVGDHLAQLTVALAALPPDGRVLDVGCGVGRAAVGLLPLLSDRGRYEGFDIMGEAVAWAEERIAPRHPRAHFAHADIFNASYNHAGAIAARDFRFPYPDRTFDVAIATSVFTHMLMDDTAHYLAEIARVLRRGGRCMATWFLLTEESRAAIVAGTSGQPFVGVGPMMTVNTAVPEQAVAYDRRRVAAMHRRAGLSLLSPVHTGAWYGRADALSYQDITVAVRR